MKKKKPFKLKVMGLFNWESEDYTVRETALLLCLVMAFVIGIIMVLKIYVISTLGVSAAVGGIAEWLEKIRNPRAP